VSNKSTHWVQGMVWGGKSKSIDLWSTLVPVKRGAKSQGDKGFYNSGPSTKPQPQLKQWVMEGPAHGRFWGGKAVGRGAEQYKIKLWEAWGNTLPGKSSFPQKRTQTSDRKENETKHSLLLRDTP